jgi:hypothetical protein
VFPVLNFLLQEATKIADEQWSQIDELHHYRTSVKLPPSYRLPITPPHAHMPCYLLVPLRWQQHLTRERDRSKAAVFKGQCSWVQEPFMHKCLPITGAP